MAEDWLDIRATLVPVGRDITARPGDRLIIAGGVCVGVYTGNKPPRAMPPPVLESAPAATHAPAAVPKPKKPAKKKPGKSVAERRAAMRAEILERLAAEGGAIPAANLTAVFGRRLQETGEHWFFRSVAHALEAEGVIERGGSGGKGVIYKLREKPAA